MYKGLRRPKTTQERRDSLKSPYVRAKRNHMNLPTHWDDIPRLNQRNWKSFRKTQHKKD